MKVFVSLTTTDSRLKLLFYTIQSLKFQTYDNFTIVVNISKNRYLQDEGISSIPDWLGGQDIVIEFVDNTGPYRKLIPLINEVDPNDLVVTADDDVIYDETWLAKIVALSKNNPGSIVCGRAKNIRKNVFGGYQNYSRWDVAIAPKISISLLPIGCAGVAYRRSLLDIEFLNDSAHLKLAATTDDIWFRCASIRRNIAVFVDPAIEEGCVYLVHKLALQEINCQKIRNERRLLIRLARRMYLELADYIGIAMSTNDRAWKNTLLYSRKVFIAE